MRKFLLIAFLICSTCCFAESFKENLSRGQEGDFIVVEQNQAYSLVRIHSHQGDLLILEEISFPSSLLKSIGKDWARWISDGAKGHLSWTMTEINLKENTLYDTFSFTKRAFLTFGEEESLLLKLFSTDLKQVAYEKRRKIGPPPLEGVDSRKVWNPPLFYQGKEVPRPKFEVFDTTLPNDASLLSGKRLELFYSKEDPSFPFPYWGQITDASEAAFKFRVIDSGRGLPSPKKKMPHRSPYFLKPPKKEGETIRLLASIPSYYTSFHLFAIDQKTFETLQNIPFTLSRNGEEVEITIPSTTWKKEETPVTFVLLFEKPEEVSIESFPIQIKEQDR